ncbi:MAG: hypothetical protein ABIX10_05985 [Acidimicrobiales bacterium]
MSQPDDLLGSEIRDALLRTPVGDADEALALSQVRARARGRRRRRRAGGAVGSIVATSLLAIAVSNVTDSERVVTEAPSAPTTSAPTPRYGFDPLTPLVDEPLPVVPSTELVVFDGHVMSVESAPNALILRTTDPSTGAGSASSADPLAMGALSFSGVGFDPEDPTPKAYLLGVTRAEVARVDWVRDSETVSVQTIANAAFPRLRFFVIEDADGVVPERPPRTPFLAAYASDGTLLTDTRRIESEQQAFHAEVDRRKGVEDKIAGIRDVQVNPDGRNMILTVFSCGGEPEPSFPSDATTIRISVTVKLPVENEDCLSGETTELLLGFDEPIGDRVILDERTDLPVPLRP